MRAKYINKGRHQFEGSLNDGLEELEGEGKIIIDIKFMTIENGNNDQPSALIIYCDPSEYREIKIDKLLDI